MAWTFLLLAGACEMIWPLGFKYTHGFSQRYWAVACTFAVMGVSLWLMGQATKNGIHVGTAYAVWTGIGAAGTALLGILLFNEPRNWMRVGCLSLIILGVIGLKFLSPPEQAGGAAGPKGDTPAAVTEGQS